MMPRITKSIAKDHLFNAVKKYPELTGSVVGVIITNKEGNTTTIGKQIFQDYVQEHRREIVRAMIRAPSSLERETYCESPSMREDSVKSTLEPLTDLSMHKIGRSRNLLTSAIQQSTGK